jgi:hypothetical protein
MKVTSVWNLTKSRLVVAGIPAVLFALPLWIYLRGLSWPGTYGNWWIASAAALNIAIGVLLDLNRRGSHPYWWRNAALSSVIVIEILLASFLPFWDSFSKDAAAELNRLEIFQLVFMVISVLLSSYFGVMSYRSKILASKLVSLPALLINLVLLFPIFMVLRRHIP